MSEEFTNEMKGDITDDDKLWALLSLVIIPIVGIIALLMEDKKERPFIKHAAWHGVGLGVIGLVIGWIPFVQCLSLVIWFYGCYLGWQAYSQGQLAEVPVLTGFLKGQGWI